MYLEGKMDFDLDSHKGGVGKHFVSISLVFLKNGELCPKLYAYKIGHRDVNMNWPTSRRKKIIGPARATLMWAELALYLS